VYANNRLLVGAECSVYLIAQEFWLLCWFFERCVGQTLDLAGA